MVALCNAWQGIFNAWQYCHAKKPRTKLQGPHLLSQQKLKDRKWSYRYARLHYPQWQWVAIHNWELELDNKTVNLVHMKIRALLYGHPIAISLSIWHHLSEAYFFSHTLPTEFFGYSVLEQSLFVNVKVI